MKPRIPIAGSVVIAIALLLLSCAIMPVHQIVSGNVSIYSHAIIFPLDNKVPGPQWANSKKGILAILENYKPKFGISAALLYRLQRYENGRLVGSEQGNLDKLFLVDEVCYGIRRGKANNFTTYTYQIGIPFDVTDPNGDKTNGHSHIVNAISESKSLVSQIASLVGDSHGQR